jgi:tRNA A-37 threonylcarbamoyl transferase component Bud32
LQSGTTLSQRYLIQEVIGVGGMGSVYRARDLHFPNVVKLVAVKEMINLAPDPLVRQTIVQNFEREANLLATLNHPSIPRIYDYFSQDDRSYLVLEFIHGKDLEAIISDSDGFLPEAQTLTWGIELCDVLAYLHAHKPDPIIFRDMKPSNVMVNHNGDIILVDFGIAKTFQTGIQGDHDRHRGILPARTVSRRGHPVGGHLRPRRHPAPRVDAPRPAPRAALLIWRTSDPKNESRRLVTELEAVIGTALQYNVEDRFPSAGDMKEALLAAGRKTGALSQMPTVSLQGNVAVKPLWTFACEDEIRGTLHPFTRARSTSAVTITTSTPSTPPTENSSGNTPPTAAWCRGPPIYEGNVYFGSEDNRLHVVGARSGKVAWTYFTEGPIRSSPRIAEGHVFFGSDDHYLHAVNMNTGRAAWKFETTSPVRSTPFVANELVYAGNESGDFYAIDFRGTLKWRFQAKRAITSSPCCWRGRPSTSARWTAPSTRSTPATVGQCGASASARDPSSLPRSQRMSSSLARQTVTSTRSIRKRTRALALPHRPSGQRVARHLQRLGLLRFCRWDHLLSRISHRRLRWKFATKGAITGAPIVYDDIVYVGSTDHNIYALLA